MKTIRVGQLGAGFIGQMHSLAFTNASLSRREPHIRADLAAIADQSPTALQSIVDRFGWKQGFSGWDQLWDQNLGLFVNAGPNDLHAEPTLEAARRGIPVFCEKPLAATADVAHRLWKTVTETGVENRCAFMHRFIPAIQLIKQMVTSGELGEVRHFRSRFMMNMVAADGSISWRFDKSRSGAGSVGDLGSHHIDLALFLVGPLLEVSSQTASWSKDRTGRIAEVNDDSFQALGRFANGATAIFEASRVASSHALTGDIQIDGSEGAVSWNMERLNEIIIRKPRHGPITQMVTRATDPLDGFWLPSGEQGSHPLGWNECFAHQAHDILGLASGRLSDSVAATFEEGYRVAEVVDTILASAQQRTTLPISLRG